MRLDKFLKVTQLIKRRTVAKETVDEGVIMVNGNTAKPSLIIKAGDKIEIDMWNYNKKVTVLSIPPAGSVPKDKISQYIQLDSYNAK